MNMKKIILISVVFHVILLAVLGPVIRTRMEFDAAKEAQRSEEVKKREAERKELDRMRREKQKLDEKTAKALKREAEQRKKEEIRHEVRQLREKRDEMIERRDRELEQFRKRAREDVLALEKKEIDRIVGAMAAHIATADKRVQSHRLAVGAYVDDGAGLAGMLDDFTVFDRLLSEEEIAAYEKLPDQPAHRWDFENGVVDAVTGDRGKAVDGGEIKARGDGTGKAFQGNGSYGRADLGRFDLGEKITFSLWVNTRAKTKNQVLFANAPNSSHHPGLRLIVEGEGDTNGAIVLRTSGSGAKAVEARTVPGTLPYDGWVNVIVTVDKSSGSGSIYLNGRKAEMLSSQVDTKTYTGDEQIDDVRKETEDLVDTFNKETPSPENRDRLNTRLDAMTDLIDKEIASITELAPVRHELRAAKSRIDDLRKRMEGLDALTDIPRMNDTSAATERRDDPPGVDEATASPAEMYDHATELEKQIAGAKADMDAAREAVANNTSYAEARENAFDGTPDRPDLSKSLGSAPPASIGDLNRFREDLNRAGNEMQDMNARADAALGRESALAMSGANFATRAAMSSSAMQSGGFGEVVDMTAFGGGGGQGDSGEMRADQSGEGASMTFGPLPETLRIDEGKIIKAAMPGRKFTRSSERKGWLYLDTWYVIGPWENNSKVDYTVKHQPEFEIDFDAVYRNGKFADRPGHPYETLKWQFYQSDQVRCQPPAVYGSSTYYAYTDVWFEEARDMLIAVASDDASSVWLNGRIVWQDTGQSSWFLGEGYRKVHFRKGFNDILVRIENGPSNCIWSVVLCPPEMLNQ